MRNNHTFLNDHINANNIYIFNRKVEINCCDSLLFRRGFVRATPAIFILSVWRIQAYVVPICPSRNSWLAASKALKFCTGWAFDMTNGSTTAFFNLMCPGGSSQGGTYKQAICRIIRLQSTQYLNILFCTLIVVIFWNSKHMQAPKNSRLCYPIARYNIALCNTKRVNQLKPQ